MIAGLLMSTTVTGKTTPLPPGGALMLGNDQVPSIPYPSTTKLKVCKLHNKLNPCQQYDLGVDNVAKYTLFCLLFYKYFV